MYVFVPIKMICLYDDSSINPDVRHSNELCNHGYFPLLFGTSEEEEEAPANGDDDPL
jgi:hypothetical protein